MLVGAISCRYEADKAQKEGKKVVYIMTITVLKAYRRYQIGSQLLNKAIDDCANSNVTCIYLHVLCSNESAIEFYKNAGFTIEKKLENYYTDLEPKDKDCYIFSKDLTGYKK